VNIYKTPNKLAILFSRHAEDEPTSSVADNPRNTSLLMVLATDLSVDPKIIRKKTFRERIQAMRDEWREEARNEAARRRTIAAAPVTTSMKGRKKTEEKPPPAAAAPRRATTLGGRSASPKRPAGGVKELLGRPPILHGKKDGGVGTKIVKGQPVKQKGGGNDRLSCDGNKKINVKPWVDY